MSVSDRIFTELIKEKEKMKKFLIKFLLLLALSSALSQGYSIESTKKQKSFDGGVASHPKVFNGKSKVKTHKREHIDNVRGEHMPKSREDIQSIKKLSYHGKMSPKAEALIQRTTRVVATTTATITSTTQRPTRPTKRRYKKKIAPVNRADRIVIKKKFRPSPKLPSSNEIIRSAIKKPEKPIYVPDDSPFYPLMRPSPINVMPTDPPSFDTVRNYVQYLKMRNEKNYADINDERPLASPLSLAQKKKTKVPFEGELEYFQEREKEIVKEQQRNRSSDESNSEDNDQREQHPYKVHEDNDDDISDDESETSNEDYDDNANDESRHRDFVPFKLYAQVRHIEADHIQPSEKPHVKEKVSLAKKNIYYKEEGYDDRMHDNGSEELKYKFNSKKHGKKRSKRSVDDLPLALALFKKSELPNLTGEKLLRHLDELIKNSSVYLPEDEDTKRPVRILAPRQSVSGRSQKFPFYNLSDNILSQMSAHRYSENFHKYPKHKESLYSSKNIKDCQDIDDEVDLDPESDETPKHPPPRRLKNLGGKIECLKLKYFGKDPFENPLFKEDEYVAATIPLPLNHTNVIARQANPLINVYDDVIRTIRAENFAEEKKKKSQEVVNDSVKLASENIPIRATTSLPRLPNYNSVAGVSQLPIFDINKFLPKFSPSYNTDDEDIDITELLYGRKNVTERPNTHLTPPPTQPPSFKKPNRPNSLPSNSHKIDSSSLIEKPKVKRNYKAKPSVERASPLGNKSPVTIQKFRRVTPHKSHSNHPPTRAAPYRFKFL